MRELSRPRPGGAGEKAQQTMDDWSRLNVVDELLHVQRNRRRSSEKRLREGRENGEPVVGPVVVDLVVSTGKRRRERGTAAKGTTESKERRNWWSTAQVPIDRRLRRRVAQGPARTKQCGGERRGEH